ncbi:MAG: hypothetical protein H0W88_07335 [Parachlamydiaceae bacterium]|nr:hypothetical protein [Parachlamydiaceae bacterium]
MGFRKLLVRDNTPDYQTLMSKEFQSDSIYSEDGVAGVFQVSTGSYKITVYQKKERWNCDLNVSEWDQVSKITALMLDKKNLDFEKILISRKGLIFEDKKVIPHADAETEKDTSKDVKRLVKYLKSNRKPEYPKTGSPSTVRKLDFDEADSGYDVDDELVVVEGGQQDPTLQYQASKDSMDQTEEGDATSSLGYSVVQSGGSTKLKNQQYALKMAQHNASKAKNGSSTPGSDEEWLLVQKQAALAKHVSASGNAAHALQKATSDKVAGYAQTSGGVVHTAGITSKTKPHQSQIGGQQTPINYSVSFGDSSAKTNKPTTTHGKLKKSKSQQSQADKSNAVVPQPKLGLAIHQQHFPKAHSGSSGGSAEALSAIGATTSGDVDMSIHHDKSQVGDFATIGHGQSGQGSKLIPGVISGSKKQQDHDLATSHDPLLQMSVLNGTKPLIATGGSLNKTGSDKSQLVTKIDKSVTSTPKKNWTILRNFVKKSISNWKKSEPIKDQPKTPFGPFLLKKYVAPEKPQKKKVEALSAQVQAIIKKHESIKNDVDNQAFHKQVAIKKQQIAAMSKAKATTKPIAKPPVKPTPKPVAKPKAKA